MPRPARRRWRAPRRRAGRRAGPHRRAPRRGRRPTSPTSARAADIAEPNERRRCDRERRRDRADRADRERRADRADRQDGALRADRERRVLRTRARARSRPSGDMPVHVSQCLTGHHWRMDAAGPDRRCRSPSSTPASAGSPCCTSASSRCRRRTTSTSATTRAFPTGPRPTRSCATASSATPRYLLDRGAKLIVIACNSAASAGLETARARGGRARGGGGRGDRARGRDRGGDHRPGPGRRARDAGDGRRRRLPAGARRASTASSP